MHRTLQAADEKPSTANQHWEVVPATCKGGDMSTAAVERMGRIRRLARLLRGLQRDEQLTSDDMARRLGVSTSMLIMVYCGRRSPGHKFLRGVLRAYPHLRDEVCQFLLRDVGD
jgi:hypothetical protein